MRDEALWHEAWRALGATPRRLFAELGACYAEPHRAYHTAQHLDECFAALAPAAHLAERIAEVRIALWFHDAIYDTRADDNELRSAQWAERALREGGAGAEAAARVAALVLATRHSAAPEGADARLLVDVDLSIFGAASARFDEYERQIRREYGWVPDEGFRQGRARVLASFLERPTIYGTAWFGERLEAPARANLARSLRALGAAAPGPAAPAS